MSWQKICAQLCGCTSETTPTQSVGERPGTPAPQNLPAPPAAHFAPVQATDARPNVVGNALIGATPTPGPAAPAPRAAPANGGTPSVATSLTTGTVSAASGTPLTPGTASAAGTSSATGAALVANTASAAADKKPSGALTSRNHRSTFTKVDGQLLINLAAGASMQSPTL